MTRYTELSKRIYQKLIPEQADKYWIVFFVPIVSSKEKSQVEYHSDDPTL